MTYGLYKGMGLIDNFPQFRKFKKGDFISHNGELPELPDIGLDGIGGIILSILLWIGMTILFIVLLIVLEAVFWFSLFIIVAMLYWVFFRALKLVFSQSKATYGKPGVSAMYSLAYTLLYIGWIFVIVYLVEIIK